MPADHSFFTPILSEEMLDVSDAAHELRNLYINREINIDRGGISYLPSSFDKIAPSPRLKPSLIQWQATVDGIERRVGAVIFGDRSVFLFVERRGQIPGEPMSVNRITILPRIFYIADNPRGLPAKKPTLPLTFPKAHIDLFSQTPHTDDGKVEMQLSIYQSQFRKEVVNRVGGMEKLPLLWEPPHGAPHTGIIQDGGANDGEAYFWPDFFEYCMVSDKEKARIQRLLKAVAGILVHRHADQLGELYMELCSGTPVQHSGRGQLTADLYYCPAAQQDALTPSMIEEEAAKMLFDSGLINSEKLAGQRYAIDPFQGTRYPIPFCLAQATIETAPSTHEVLQYQATLRDETQRLWQVSPAQDQATMGAALG